MLFVAGMASCERIVDIESISALQCSLLSNPRSESHPHCCRSAFRKQSRREHPGKTAQHLSYMIVHYEKGKPGQGY
jgi:hypothetical protein